MPTLRACALRERACALRERRPLWTAVALTSTVDMLAKLTPALAREATWVWSEEEHKALEALRRDLVMERTSVPDSKRSIAAWASSKSERAVVMSSFALNVERSIASEAASAIDPWWMSSWSKATSSAEAWRAFSRGWASILP